MMKFNRRNLSTIFLLLGVVFLAIGFSTDNTLFSWISVVFILISLLAGGRWMRPRKK
jgi:hypothetical protein